VQNRKGCKAYTAYGRAEVSERHRHRYEFNNVFLPAFKKSGMIPTGFNPDTGLVEIVEIPAQQHCIKTASTVCGFC